MPRLQFIHLCALYCAFTTLVSAAVAETPNVKADRLFDTQHIIDVQITMSEDDWDAVRTPSRSFFEALQGETAKSPFKYRKATVTVDGVKIENVAIRKKGSLGRSIWIGHP